MIAHTLTGALAIACSLSNWMASASAQNATSSKGFEVHTELRISAPNGKPNNPPPAVLWLRPLSSHLATDPLPVPRGGFTLLQKNKAFVPHILVVPVGTTVSFPNQDPFFHNVFSLFDGKRFDLGLYEAGRTKGVTFSREGVSYIFCNIHSEMSAVIVAVDTPFYSVSDRKGEFLLSDVPAGEYELHVWVEGQPQSNLNSLTRRVIISSQSHTLDPISIGNSKLPASHPNKLGQPYDRNATRPY